jgi:regulator of sigma E protease
MNGVAGVVVTILAFAVVITLVVVVHEGGHFVVAKLAKIRVDGFSVGFGPAIFKFRRGETLYAVRVLPLGGYVQMAGMLGLEGEADAGERNFYRAKIPWKVAVIVAGVVSNIIFGGFCLSVVFAQPTPSTVVAGEPTARAGLVSGDVVLSVAGRPISYASTTATDDDFYAAVQSGDGQTMPVTYQGTDGKDHTVGITPELVVYALDQPSSFPGKLAGGALVVTSVNGASPGSGDPAAILGGGATVTISGFLEGDSSDRFTNVQISGVRDGNGSQTAYAQAAWRIGFGAGVAGEAPIQALRDGFGLIPTYLVDEAQVIGQLFTQPSQATQQLEGPVGIAAAAGTAVRQGWVQFIWLIGLISLAVGFINVLPIPFLDGGRLLFIAIEAVRRRRLAATPQAVAIAISLAFIILFVVIITISNIHQLAGGAP